MRPLLILVAICFSATAFAQSVPAKVGKPVTQVKPKAPAGCKLVGTVRGTKLWAGDCVAPTETQSSSEQTSSIIPPEKE